MFGFPVRRWSTIRSYAVAVLLLSLVWRADLFWPASHAGDRERRSQLTQELRHAAVPAGLLGVRPIGVSSPHQRNAPALLTGNWSEFPTPLVTPVGGEQISAVFTRAIERPHGRSPPVPPRA